MAAIAELDVVTTTTDITAQVIGESRSITLPAGTVGTVVIVHTLETAIAAFVVEFFLGEFSYALATVRFDQVVRVAAA
jgi:hypothetical protein